MSEMAERYKYVSGSETGHCCFEASVVDTSKELLDGDGKPYGYFKVVCECFSEDDARQIAAAMNAALTHEPTMQEEAPEQPPPYYGLGTTPPFPIPKPHPE